MNVFKNFTNNITEGINQLEGNINNTIYNVKRGIGIGLLTKNSPEMESILSDLNNGREPYGIKPEDIDGLTKEEAINYILSKRIFIDVDDTEDVNPYIKKQTNYELEDYEKTQKILEDPRMSDIFYEIRSEFPEPTNTPEPKNTPEPTNTPRVNIEGFENVPLSTVAKVNKHLKEKFIDNFTFK